MRKPVLVLFTLLATILGAVPATASPPYAVEEPLWTGAGTAGTPSAWGGTAAGITAWECDNGTDWDVFVRGLDGTIAVVPLGSTDQRHPVVQGGADAQHVFYEHDPLGTGDWDVFVSALSELLAPSGVGVSSESPIAIGPGQQLDPDSSGSWVVYEDDSRGNWDICAYDIVTDVRRRIVSNSAAQRDPAISGSHVVFADRRNGNWDIYDYDLETRTLRRLTTNRSDQIRPQVGQGVVVYQDHRNGNWDIYAYTLSTGKERRLTTDPADQTNPGLDNHPFGSVRSVVYQSSRDGDTDVYVCELKTGISKRVTDGAGPQTEPSISRSFVVWTDGRASAPGIYGCRLLFPSVYLTAPGGTTAYNASAEVTGHLQLNGGAGVGQRVYIEDRGTRRWVTIPGPGSDFSVLIPNLVRKVTLSAVYPGDDARLPAVSASVEIKPQARLTTPVLKRKPGRNVDGRYITTADCTVTGYLKPRHATGSMAVSILCYRWQSSGGTWWKQIKTVKVKVGNYRTYSKYSATVTLKGGPWKVKAFHMDRDHAPTETGFSKTTGTSW